MSCALLNSSRPRWAGFSTAAAAPMQVYTSWVVAQVSACTISQDEALGHVSKESAGARRSRPGHTLSHPHCCIHLCCPVATWAIAIVQTWAVPLLSAARAGSRSSLRMTPDAPGKRQLTAPSEIPNYPAADKEFPAVPRTIQGSSICYHDPQRREFLYECERWSQLDCQLHLGDSE